MAPKNTKSTAAVMEVFVYNYATVHVDWPRWFRKFEIFLIVQGITRSSNEGKAEALAHMLHSGGDKLFDIFYAHEKTQDEALTFDTFKALLDKQFAQINNMVALVGFRTCLQGF